jgi:peptidoglycan biosynthesis protein MviN/MurJ (putative lipid II flippase)
MVRSLQLPARARPAVSTLRPSFLGIVGTGASRATGVLRLAFTALTFADAPKTADIFNVTSNVPNMVTEYLGGGLLLSVFASTLAFRDSQPKTRVIGLVAVLGGCAAGVTLVASLFAPAIMRLLEIHGPLSDDVTTQLIRIAMLQVPFYLVYSLLTAAEHRDGRFGRPAAFTATANVAAITALEGYRRALYGIVDLMALSTASVALPVLLLIVLRRDWSKERGAKWHSVIPVLRQWLGRSPTAILNVAVSQVPLILAIRAGGNSAGTQALLLYAVSIPVTLSAVVLMPIANVRLALHPSGDRASVLSLLSIGAAIALLAVLLIAGCTRLLEELHPTDSIWTRIGRDATWALPGVLGVGVSYYLQRRWVIERRTGTSFLLLLLEVPVCALLYVVVPEFPSRPALLWASSWICICAVLWVMSSRLSVPVRRPPRFGGIS